MFSSIIELIQKIQEAKLRKQKKETKKVVKEEEKKIEEKEEKSLVEVKSKAKETKKVKKETLKEIKLKAKVLALKVLKYVVKIIESFVKFLIATFGVMGFFVILVVIVLMIAIYGLLHIDFDLPSGDIYNGGNEDCIQGSEVFTSGTFDISQISSLMGTFTEQDKQAAEILTMYANILNRDLSTVVENDKAITKLKEKIGVDNVIFFAYGFGAIENTGGVRNIPTNGDSLFKYPSTQTGSSYAFLGLHRGNTFNGKYSYNGNSSNATQVLKDSFVAEIKNSYTPIETPVHENNFMPYGVSTQLGVLSTNYLLNKFDFVESSLPTVMDAYGIKENRNILEGFIQMFSGSAAYHSGGSTTDARLFSVWCALWSATSQEDSKRSFNNIKIINSSYNYTEPQMRPYIFGSKNFYITWGEQKSGYFEIDGKSVDTVLWDWVSKNCSNPEYFETTAKPWLEEYQGSKNGDSVITDSSYGLAAYLVGRDLSRSLGATAPVVTGGNSEDCDCVESGGGSVGSFDISSIQVGQVQGPWSENTKQKLQSKSGAEYYGQATAISSPDTQHFTGVTLEEWRQNTKWKVPHYIQGPSYLEGGKNTYRLGSDVGMDSACHDYMYSYMASALTGKVINAVEMGNALKLFGGVTASGANNSSNVVNVFHDLGLKFYRRRVSDGYSGDFEDIANYFGVTVEDLASDNSETLQRTVDKILEKNGIAGFACYRPIAYGVNHYIVVTEKVGDKYRIMGYRHGNSYSNGNSDLYEWSFFFPLMYTHAKSGYHGQRYFAYNPNLSVSGGSSNSNSPDSDLGGSRNNFGKKVSYSGGEVHDAYFTAYCPFGENVDVDMEGGLNDCMGNPLIADSNTLATPNIDSLPYGVKLVIDGTGTDLDGKVFYGKDHGGAINVDSDGRYHFDVLLADAEAMSNWSNPSGKIYIEPTVVESSQTQNVDCIPAKTTNGPAAGMTNANETRDERWKRVMGDKNYSDYYLDSWTGVSARAGSTTWQPYVDIMQSNDVAKVSLKAWDLDSNKNWVSYDFDMLVNKNLASSIEAMFNELYALPEKDRTPIHKSLYEDTVSGVTYMHNGGCFSYYPRGGGSIHCIGAAIDINPDENPMPGQYGDIKNYKPGVDPYSIMDTSKLVEIFGKYGFERGRSYKDYMHFSYLESVEENKNTYGG